jgi:hypothetical protein
MRLDYLNSHNSSNIQSDLEQHYNYQELLNRKHKNFLDNDALEQSKRRRSSGMKTFLYTFIALCFVLLFAWVLFNIFTQKPTIITNNNNTTKEIIYKNTTCSGITITDVIKEETLTDNNKEEPHTNTVEEEIPMDVVKEEETPIETLDESLEDRCYAERVNGIITMDCKDNQVSNVPTLDSVDKQLPDVVNNEGE